LSLWPEALLTYQELDKLSPSSEVSAKLAKASEELGQTKQALAYYDSSIQEGASAQAYLGLSRILKNEMQDSSLVLAKQAFDLTFSKLTSYEKKLNQKLQGKNTLNGLIDNESLIQNIQKEERFASKAFYHLASFPFDGVSELIIGLTEQFPQSAKIHTYIGEYLYRHDLTEKSHSFLLKSVRLAPNQKEAHNLLGKIYQQKEQYQESILAFERSLSLDNTDTKIYRNLINLYSKTGQLDQLCNKWMIRYQSGADHQILKQPLIEALHKAGRYEEAKKIIGEKI